jgi:hypothetical protein
MRLTVLVAALTLLLAATADAKTNVRISPALTTLQPGKPAKLTLTMEHAAHQTPVITFTEYHTGEVVAATGTESDARGVSTVTVTLPSAGLWQPKVLMDEGSFAPMPFRIDAPARTVTSTGGSGFPWVPVAVLAAVAAGLLALARRRLGSPPPRAA